VTLSTWQTSDTVNMTNQWHCQHDKPVTLSTWQTSDTVNMSNQWHCQHWTQDTEWRQTKHKTTAQKTKKM